VHFDGHFYLAVITALFVNVLMLVVAVLIQMSVSYVL